MCISYKAIALCEMLCNVFHSNKTTCGHGVSLSIPAYTGGGGSCVGVLLSVGPYIVNLCCRLWSPKCVSYRAKVLCKKV